MTDAPVQTVGQAIGNPKADEPTPVTPPAEKPAAPPAAASSPAPATPPARPDGSRPVNVREAKPEEIEARIGYLYSQVKHFERGFGELKQHNEKLSKAVDQFLAEQATEKQSAQLKDLKAEKVQALERADYNRVADIDQQLTEIVSKPAVAPTVTATPEQVAASEPAPFNLSPEQTNVVRTWMAETNPDGTFKRPWAMPGSPEQEAAATIAAGITASPRMKGQPLAVVLQAVDRAVNAVLNPTASTQASVVSATPTVMGGNQRRAPKAEDVELSQDQITVAKRMGIPLDRYKAQLKVLRTSTNG